MPLSEHHTADEAVEAAKAAAHDTDAIIYVRDRYGRCRPVRRAAKGRFATTK
jgi:hypothetical protein